MFSGNYIGISLSLGPSSPLSGPLSGGLFGISSSSPFGLGKNILLLFGYGGYASIVYGSIF